MAWKCKECGSVFEEPEVYEQWSEAWGRPVHEDFDICPHCHSTDIDETDEEPDDELRDEWDGIHDNDDYSDAIILRG